MKVYTIGFTKKSASTFFKLLGRSGAERVVDVRLNNISQLAGFAKRDDLKYFLAELCGMGYVHELQLAPNQTMLSDYRKRGASWGEYEQWYVDLVSQRRVEETVPRDLIANSVLLCSEATPHHCHRRLAAEYLAEQWGDVIIEHL